MSNPPSPLADVRARVTDARTALAYSGRLLAAGDVRLAAAVLRATLVLLGDLAADVESLEPAEYPAALWAQTDDGPDAPAKMASGLSPGLRSALGRALGPSVASHPESGYADEPLF